MAPDMPTTTWHSSSARALDARAKFTLHGGGARKEKDKLLLDAPVVAPVSRRASLAAWEEEAAPKEDADSVASAAEWILYIRRDGPSDDRIPPLGAAASVGHSHVSGEQP